jgi:putative tryptophan/tyrosine transport system substrate-binding protein
MRRIGLAVALALSLVLASHAAEAQQTGKLWRIGILFYGSPSAPGPLTSLLDGLRDVGVVEGRTAVFEIRYAEGQTERYSTLAAELVRLRVDLLVAVSTPAIIAAKQATSTIPIVMAAASDPVGTRLVASLAHPGGNITGLSLLAPELSAKRLDLITQTVSPVSRVAVLWNLDNEGMALRFREAQAASRSLGVSIQSVGVRTPADFDGAFSTLTKERPHALLVMADTVTIGQRKRTTDFAASQRLPAIYEARDFVDVGGLMSYGIDGRDHFRRTATFVDRILKGAKPADLPVEQPTKFELVINLKTAKAIGLTIPQPLLLRADQVIE